MAKKQYVQAKKDIEALLQENGDSEICAGISEYSSVWEEAFKTERIYEGESIIGFENTDNALEIQKVLNHALKNCSKLEKIMVVKCNNIKPKPKVKKMDTLEKVQEYLSRL